MKKIILSILTCSTLFQTNSYAQDVTDNEVESISIGLINTKHSKLDIVKDLKSVTDKHPTETQVPTFLLYDKNNDIAFGIGGSVRLRTAYDFNGSPTNSFGFIPYSIPSPKDPLTKNDFRMDASKSSVFFNLLGNNSKIGKFQAYVSGNFTGDGNNFTLNDAYIKLLGFTVGRTWSTFNDMASVPLTVDFQGPNGAAELRTSQIRYTYNTNNGLSFALAAELPQLSGTYTDKETAETTQRVPNIPAYVQYSWGGNNSSHVRLAGVMTNKNYRNLIDNKTETVTALGMQLSSNVNINPIVELYGQINYGKGIDQYINDLSGNGLSLVKSPDKSGKMDALEALGWFAQMKFNLSEAVFASVGYSQAKIFPKEGVFNPDQYRYGQYVVGNVFYNLDSSIQFGLEYLWGNRVNIDHEKGSANCIQTVIQFNF